MVNITLIQQGNSKFYNSHYQPVIYKTSEHLQGYRNIKDPSRMSKVINTQSQKYINTTFSIIKQIGIGNKSNINKNNKSRKGKLRKDKHKLTQ